MLGSYNKKITRDEKINLKSIRRSIYAKSKINKGDKISIEKINFLRPYNKKSSNLKKVLNKIAKKNISPNLPIKLIDIS